MSGWNARQWMMFYSELVARIRELDNPLAAVAQIGVQDFAHALATTMTICWRLRARTVLCGNLDDFQALLKPDNEIAGFSPVAAISIHFPPAETIQPSYKKIGADVLFCIYDRHALSTDDIGSFRRLLPTRNRIHYCDLSWLQLPTSRLGVACLISSGRESCLFEEVFSLLQDIFAYPFSPLELLERLYRQEHEIVSLRGY
jgi:hypothetical protein